ncbi:MAG: DNA primase small subunit domain-containing protein [Candidatus Pacearchaeota archaeon]|jgi:hypothetical protein
MEQKEERIRAIAISYYSRKDVLNTIFDYSQDREVSPRYFEGFGKRPDSFQYPSDIIALVKRGATSFHCSEELWKDPLQISTDLSLEKLNDLRKGWDLVIDIDCKWIEYSKKAAISVITALEFRGIKNFLVKFSGSKGFHIVVPWQSFPEKLDEINVKDMFPEYARIILLYIKELARPILEDLIKESNQDFSNLKDFTGVKCEKCNLIAQERFLINLRCDSCYPPYIESFKSSTKEYKSKKCPACGKVMDETTSKSFFYCNKCNTDSVANPDNFQEKIISTDIFKILGLDLQLVSSRHLFRMPYSLHEKTSLVSIPVDKNKLKDFQLKDADPFNIKVSQLQINPKKDEAKELLIQALDWYKSQNKEEKLFNNSENESDSSNQDKNNKNKKFEQIKLTSSELKEEYFPPSISKILVGMEDGRKRGLFILLNFFKSLGLTMTEIEKRVNDWNLLNKPPLKQGYINSQLVWHSKQKVVLPPNFDNDIYKDLGIFEMDDLSQKTKNPVAYVIRKSGAWKKTSNNQNNYQNKTESEKPKVKRKRKKKGELYEIELR